MSTPPKIYRVCSYDALQQILSADFIEAPTDDEAIAAAHAAGFGTKGEVWDGSRLVAELSEKSVAA